MKKLISIILLIFTMLSSVLFPSSLSGTKLELASWSESSVDPSGFSISLEFQKGSFNGRSAVNLYGGSYKAGDEKLTFSHIHLTAMAGEPEAMRAEDTYMRLLDQTRKYVLDGESLTLFDGDGNQLMVFQKAG